MVDIVFRKGIAEKSQKLEVNVRNVVGHSVLSHTT